MADKPWIRMTPIEQIEHAIKGHENLIIGGFVRSLRALGEDWVMEDMFTLEAKLQDDGMKMVAFNHKENKNLSTWMPLERALWYGLQEAQIQIYE